MALRTSNSCETSLQPPAVKKCLHRPRNHRAQGSRAGLETFFIRPDITVKVSLKKLPMVSSVPGKWGILYAAGRNGGPSVRRRVITDPKPFLRARREIEQEDPASVRAGEELLRNLDMVGAIARRAARPGWIRGGARGERRGRAPGRARLRGT
jgi:hypothetical protein